MQILRILVIDPDETAGLSLGSLTQTLDHAATVATSGDEALSYLRTMPFDVVLADSKLPHFTTVTLLDQISAIQPSLPIVIVADDVEGTKVLAALEQGACDVLHKPVAVAWLQVALKRAMDYHKRRDDQNQGTTTQTPHDLAWEFAHAINNPVATVFGLAQLIINSPDLPATLRPDMELVVEHTERLSHIVLELATRRQRGGES